MVVGEAVELVTVKRGEMVAGRLGGCPAKRLVCSFVLGATGERAELPV